MAEGMRVSDWQDSSAPWAERRFYGQGATFLIGVASVAGALAVIGWRHPAQISEVDLGVLGLFTLVNATLPRRLWLTGAMLLLLVGAGVATFTGRESPLKSSVSSKVP